MDAEMMDADIPFAGPSSPNHLTRSRVLAMRRKWTWVSPHHELIFICRRLCPIRKYAPLLSTDAKEKAAAREASPLSGCGQSIISLLHQQNEALYNRKGLHSFVVKRCDDLIEIAHEKFYSFPFDKVPPCWTELYRDASLVKFAALSMTGLWYVDYNDVDYNCDDISVMSETQLDNMVRTIDMALIMTGPPPDSSIRKDLDEAMEVLGRCDVTSPQDDEERAAKRQRLDPDWKSCEKRFPSTVTPAPRLSQANRVSRALELSFEAFEDYMRSPLDPDLGPEPIVICGMLKEWPALKEQSWENPEYLRSKTIGGRRLVPVETGTSYVDASFGQSIITFNEFMDQYILNPDASRGMGYLAQHNLFSQIPSLRKDIMIPDYCFTSPPGPHPSSPFAEAHRNATHLEEPLLSAWFGPAGTTTPLHTDPYHNILAQVVGKKYIRLYPPNESMNMYAKETEDGIDMSNTSEVDVGVLAGLDGTPEEIEAAKKKFPLFKKAHYLECVLNEGECLYIPIGWWHYVRSLSVSFSVSFWFN